MYCCHSVSQADAIHKLQESQCAEIAIRENTTKGLDACWKASADAWEERKQHAVRRMYAAYWPFILAATVGIPLLVYGTLQGIATVCLWIWRGYSKASTCRIRRGWVAVLLDHALTGPPFLPTSIAEALVIGGRIPVDCLAHGGGAHERVAPRRHGLVSVAGAGEIVVQCRACP